MAASGSFIMIGTASLQLEVSFAAAGSFTLSGAAALTTEILMAAAGLMELDGEASLRTGKRAATLSQCGGLLAADCDEWLLRIFKRQE
jgi:hypothetical protein